jgi:fucose 4-O-acetylase-like acetyltransferase
MGKTGQDIASARTAASTSPSLSTSRLNWVDGAKGLGIILVVYGHASRGMISAGALQNGPVLQFADYAIYTFHMPLFFCLAGLFAERSLAKGYQPFLRSKLATIVYPYFLWSLIQVLLLSAAGGLTNNTASPLLRLANILWTPIAPFWFLYSLFLCHLAFAGLSRLSKSWLIGIAVILFVVGEIARGGTHDIAVLSDTTRGFLFYVAGVVAAPRIAHAGASTRLEGLIGLGMLALLGLAAWIGFTKDIPYEINVIAAFAGIGFIALIVRQSSFVCAAASRVGIHSMAIYVMHIAIVASARILALRLLHIHDEWAVLACMLLLGITIPILAHVVMIRLGIASWFGLPAERPDSRRTAALS